MRSQWRSPSQCSMSVENPFLQQMRRGRKLAHSILLILVLWHYSADMTEFFGWSTWLQLERSSTMPWFCCRGYLNPFHLSFVWDFCMTLDVSCIEVVSNGGFWKNFRTASHLPSQFFMPMVINGHVKWFIIQESVVGLVWQMEKVVSVFGAVLSNL